MKTCNYYSQIQQSSSQSLNQALLHLLEITSRIELIQSTPLSLYLKYPAPPKHKSIPESYDNDSNSNNEYDMPLIDSPDNSLNDPSANTDILPEPNFI